MSTQALLVTNSAAGSADDEAVSQVQAILRQGGDLRVSRTDGPEALEDVVSTWSGDHVIVAGGDGSLHLMINTLDRLDRLDTVTVGLIPLGTGNDFAAGVGISDDPAEAAQACLAGSPQPVDVVRADDGELVVNVAHAGIGAVAAQRAQPAKDALGQLAYPLGALRAGISESGYRMTLTLDGEQVHQGTMLMTLVANGPCIGGGAQLCSGADPTDGLIDLVVIDSMPVHERAGLALAIQRDTLGERDDVHRWRGHEVRIAGEPLDHNRDGEIRTALTDVSYTVRPAAWQLLR